MGTFCDFRRIDSIIDLRTNWFGDDSILEAWERGRGGAAAPRPLVKIDPSILLDVILMATHRDFRRIDLIIDLRIDWFGDKSILDGMGKEEGGSCSKSPGKNRFFDSSGCHLNGNPLWFQKNRFENRDRSILDGYCAHTLHI